MEIPFALPDLKKSPFSGVTIYDKKLANRIIPKENSDKIAVVYLKDKSVTDVKYILDKELQNIFK